MLLMNWLSYLFLYSPQRDIVRPISRINYNFAYFFLPKLKISY